MKEYSCIRKSNLIVADFNSLKLNDWVEGIGFLDSIALLEAVKLIGNVLQKEYQKAQSMANGLHEELSTLKSAVRELVKATDNYCEILNWGFRDEQDKSAAAMRLDSALAAVEKLIK